ncbi:hypothetical protein [Nostoc sp.]
MSSEKSRSYARGRHPFICFENWSIAIAQLLFDDAIATNFTITL